MACQTGKCGTRKGAKASAHPTNSLDGGLTDPNQQVQHFNPYADGVIHLPMGPNGPVGHPGQRGAIGPLGGPALLGQTPQQLPAYRYRPNGERLIVFMDPVPEKTEGGIELLADTQPRSNSGRVLAIGQKPTLQYSQMHGFNPSPLLNPQPPFVVGQRVIFNAFAPVVLDPKEPSVVIMDWNDVLAVDTHG